MSRVVLKCGDCLELMKGIPDGSVDMVLSDLPYGVLNKGNHSAKWDSVIPMEPLWGEFHRVIRGNGAIVLFGQGMFTARMMVSNPGMWRYNLIWKKGDRASGFLNANRQPLRNHEDIMVFAKGQTPYYPQMEKCAAHKRNHGRGDLNKQIKNQCYGDFVSLPTKISDEKYPKSVLNFDKEFPRSSARRSLWRCVSG